MESKKRKEKEVDGKRNERICRFFNRGFCKDSSCPFLHLLKFTKNSLLLDPARGAAVVVKDIHINVNIG